jgi:flagellar M-ring protein FliF
VSYEISRTVARTLTAPGELRRLSVAVLLRMPKGGQAGGAPAAPRPAEEIEKIKRMVMGAVGYDADRGDQVTVVEIPADVAVPEPATPAAEPAPPAPPARMADPVLVGGAAAAMVALGVAVWLWRRRTRARALTDVVRTLQGPATPAAPRTGTGVPAVAAMEGSGADPLSVPEEFVRLGRERDGLRQQALDLATGEPAAAAQLIRAWMVKKRALEPGGGAAHAG